MTASVMWKELTAEDLRAKAAADAIVILPVASMEQHGPHLPVGVDTILCEGGCKAGAEAEQKAAAPAPAPMNVSVNVPISSATAALDRLMR